MKVALIEILQEARKWAAERHQKYIDSLTPEQLGIIAKMQEEAAQYEEPDEKKNQEKRFVYPPSGRNWVIFCMTNKLCADGFAPDEAHLISMVAVSPEERTPEELKKASELKLRGPNKKPLRHIISCIL